LAQALRDRLEGALEGLDLPDSIWISKDRLSEHAACEGRLQAALAREGPPFAHSLQSAAGTLLHRAVQLDIASERAADVRSVVDRAAVRLVDDDRSFALFWRGMDALDRADLAGLAACELALFREMFPPLERAAQPVSEQLLIAKLAGGRVVLSGRIDLIVGRRSRILLDFKRGDAWPAHAEDMRFYGLLSTLMFDAPPRRVATVYLASMEWQAEEVDRRILDHAADRVIATATTAAELAGGRTPHLSPGRHCEWCPRARDCPRSAVRAAAASAGDGLRARLVSPTFGVPTFR
jgi:RecB family exonuclease